MQTCPSPWWRAEQWPAGVARVCVTYSCGRPVVVLNLWGSWCAPCREEAPQLQAAWVGFAGRAVQFVGINTQDDEVSAARAFEVKYGVTYPSLRDPEGRVQLMFRSTLPPNAIPSTLVLDASGRIAARVIGATTRETLAQIIEELLNETGTP